MISAALALTLSACAVGPRYSPPATPPSAVGPFISAGPSNADQPLPERWWRLYQDPVLDGLVQTALAENQDLKVAAANLTYAQGLLDEARSGRYPSTDLSGGPSYGRATPGAPTSLVYAAGFVASYQVDLFGRVSRAIEAARATAGADADALDAARVTVASETASAYADVCGFGRQLAVARHSLNVVSQTYDITVRQRDAGALSDFDVAREAVLLEQARAAIAPLDGQRRSALFTLAALIGKTPAEVPADAARCQAPPTLTQALPVGDGAALLRRRPDVRQAERQLAAATANIGVAMAELYPTITLAGSVSSAASTVGGLFNASSVAYGVGSNSSNVTPLITWSFPNISLARAHIRERRAQASGALANFDSVVLTALKETEQALATLASEGDHRAALAAARGRADEALRLAGIEYQSGTASFLDLLQAQAAAVAADQALAASEQTLAADQVAVFQALGGGWEDAPKVIPPVIAR